ncbi:MAG TPA: secretin N-terminal domain-containing protein, partial [Candidatus Wallbacteria bacterium]|nr:secretin N-terminal domain-containing protein [Candidatus Wallbacteria bacterium]
MKNINANKFTFLNIVALVIILAFNILAANAPANGSENDQLKNISTGYLSELPRSDAQIIFKKVKDSLELCGVNEKAYEIKYVGETNSYILKAKDAETEKIVKETIANIEKYYYGTIQSEVIYLQYASSKTVASLLNNIYSPRIFSTAPATPPPPKNAHEKNPGEKNPAGPAMKLIKKRNECIDITHDERTNAILVKAPRNIIDMVKDTIQKIDRRTSLVHVKVLIAEISIDDTSQFGLEWKYAAQNLTGGKSVRQDTGVDFGNLNDPTKQAKLQGLKYGVINGERFNSFLQMLNSKNNINVLSSPQLLTTNNSKAYFEETIKIPTIQKVTTSTGIINDSIEYQEIGIKLSVLPQVNRDGYINMGIDQTIQNVISTTGDLNAPTFSHRMINTNVITKNGSTVVISGFIKNNRTKSAYKTPLFENVPFLKDIFSKNSTKNEKTELMVFITPKIVTTENKVKEIVDDLHADSNLKKKLAPIASDYDNYEQETSEGRFVVVDVKDGTVILNGG